MLGFEPLLRSSLSMSEPYLPELEEDCAFCSLDSFIESIVVGFETESLLISS